LIIEQAKGKLAERLGVDMDQAFSLLRDLARARYRHLSDMARALVDGTETLSSVPARPQRRLPATEPAFAGTIDESARYLQARAWAASHGMPRHLFCRFAGERKPIYADLTSLASIDLISRSLRRSRRTVGPDATVNFVEMMPTPDQAWLTDAQGQRYTAELRMVAVDQLAAVRKQEG